jgi:hypothetical protein
MHTQRWGSTSKFETHLVDADGVAADHRLGDERHAERVEHQSEHGAVVRVERELAHAAQKLARLGEHLAAHQRVQAIHTVVALQRALVVHQDDVADLSMSNQPVVDG